MKKYNIIELLVYGILLGIFSFGIIEITKNIIIYILSVKR
jgi:hypothetical protein